MAIMTSQPCDLKKRKEHDVIEMQMLYQYKENTNQPSILHI